MNGSPRQSVPRAVILLAGSISAGRLSTAAGRSLPELPIAEGLRVWDLWLDALEALAGHLNVERLLVRVVFDHKTPVTLERVTRGAVSVEVERDPDTEDEPRGPGGLLSDLVRSYGDDDRVLVSYATQLPPGSLPQAVDQLMASDGDMVMAAGEELVPAGLMLLRCACLRGIRDQGFADFHEQTLPKLKDDWDIRIVKLDQPPGLSVRTANGYLKAVEAHALGKSEAEAEGVQDAYAERGRSRFSLIEEGAEVAGDAVVCESVVLRGGVVRSGAVVRRSVVCPGGVVGADGAEGAVVTAAGLQNAGELATVENPAMPAPVPPSTGKSLRFPRHLQKLGWSVWTLLFAAALTLAMVALMWDGWQRIHEVASHDERGWHVFAVPVLAGLVAYFRLRRLQLCRVHGSGPGVVMIVLGVAGYLMGGRGDIEVLKSAGTVLAAVGAVVVVLGREVLVQFLPAFAMLALLVPLPGRVYQWVHRPVTRLTEMVTQDIYAKLGLNVTVDGSFAGAGEAFIRVGHAFSTFFLIMTMMMIGYAYFFGKPFKAWARIAGLVATFGIGVVVLVVGAAASLWLLALAPAELLGPLSILTMVLMLGATYAALLLLTKWLDWAYVPLRPYRLAYQG